MKITQGSFNNILKKNFLFENKPKIAVAVSGGPDSMALIFLLNKWIKKVNGNLIALVVDHKIRKNSDTEALNVKKYLTENDILSYLIKVKEKNILKKTMNEARKNRFNALTNFCIRNNIFHLFLGHHFDDNIETFLMRRVAGSNFYGLNSIREKIIINSIQILRPLLCFTKSDILVYNNKKKIFYITDPSNSNLNYTRVVIRKFLLDQPRYKTKIKKDFKTIQKFFPIYTRMIFQIFHKLNLKNSHNNIIMDSYGFFCEDNEIQSQIIQIIYKFLKPKKESLRDKKIVNLINLLKKHKAIKANIAGLNIKKDILLISFLA